MVAQRIPQLMTADTFFKLPETNLPTELIDGVLLEMPSPNVEHQRLLRRFARAVEDIIPEGEVFVAPLDVYLDDLNVVQPDVFWVSLKNPRCVILEQHVRGAPDLVIEILSPGTARKDRKTKFHLYQRHGVREYWLVHPGDQLIEVWQLVGERFQRVDVYGVGDTLTSPLLGTMPVDPLFAV